MQRPQRALWFNFILRCQWLWIKLIFNFSLAALALKRSRRVLPMMSKRRSSISLKCSGEQFSGMMRNKLQYKHFSIACRVFVCVAMSKINCNPLSTSTYSWERLSKLFLRRLVVRKKLPQINFSFYYRFVFDRVPFLRFFFVKSRGRPQFIYINQDLIPTLARSHHLTTIWRMNFYPLKWLMDQFDVFIIVCWFGWWDHFCGQSCVRVFCGYPQIEKLTWAYIKKNHFSINYLVYAKNFSVIYSSPTTSNYHIPIQL